MKLLEPVKLGNRTLKNRMAMAAMTRSRADARGLIGKAAPLYYKQRASAGLIISEGINISEQARGYCDTPGIYTGEQVDAWKKVTRSVHGEGGVIYAQLWHTGRTAHSIDKNGALPLAPSAIRIKSLKHFTSQGPMDYETPVELSVEQIGQTVQDYARAAFNAIEAGFDGVELHAANGYLPNQFLAESTNQRTDAYGGSIENHCRFVLEVMHALISAIGGDKVGIKISPLQSYPEIELLDPIATFSYLIQELNKMEIAFVELMRRVPKFPLLPGYPEKDELELFGPAIKHTLIANSGFDRETGEMELRKGVADIISYGELFLANPDLPRRFELNAALNQANHQTFYGGGEKGYIDYPFLNRWRIFPR